MSTQTTANEQALIVNIQENPQPIRIESLCIACGKNGQTILLLTKIPFFKELMIGSFSCQACGNRNNEVQFVGELPQRGVSISFKVTERSDLDREVIKSEHAIMRFQELGLQIPESKRAEISTIQGILMKIQTDLSEAQEDRKLSDHQSYMKIQHVINRIHQYIEGKHLPFTVSIVDPSGNSNIKNPFAPKLDSRLFISYFNRNVQQLTKMGYNQKNAQEQLSAKNKNNEQVEKKEQEHEQIKEQEPQQPTIKKIDFTQAVTDKDFLKNQLSVFEMMCHACQMPGLMKLCQTSIPHFSDMVIMSFSCDYCGAHSTETKNSGVVSDKSTTITLKVNNAQNLKRDMFKSETSSLNIPQLGVQLDYGTLGGVYTTVEGLLQKIQDHMQQMNPFTDSDSDFAVRIRQVIDTLQKMRDGQIPFTIILKDPLSSSFIQNPYHPEDDKDAVIETRERTEEEKDFLGINQMSV